MSFTCSILGDIAAEKYDNETLPAGSAAIALALRELGADVMLRSALGADEDGEAVLSILKRARVHPGLIDRADSPTATVVCDESGRPVNRTAGVSASKGLRMDIYTLFGRNAFILDTADQPLRRFISDLPAHTDGMVRMVTTLSHLDFKEPTEDELEIALRCDAIVGTDSQFLAMTGANSLSDALGDVFDRMHLNALRVAIGITPDGLDLVARDARILKPIQDASPWRLVPQTTAAVAWALATHQDWDTAATVAADPGAMPA